MWHVEETPSMHFGTAYMVVRDETILSWCGPGGSSGAIHFQSRESAQLVADDLNGITYR